MDYIDKLKKTSIRDRKPVNTYLCEHCLTWHLTSIISAETGHIRNLNRQIENLKSKVAHLEAENKRLLFKQ